MYWRPIFSAILSPAWPASIGAKCTVSLTPTQAASRAASVVVRFFITACRANLCVGHHPAPDNTLPPLGPPPQPVQGRPNTHTQAVVRAFNPKMCMFSAGMVGSYEGPAGLPGTEKILGFRPSRTKSGGTFGVFFPIGRVEASVFVRGDCPEPRIFGPLCQGAWGFTRVPRVRVLAGALLPSAAMRGLQGGVGHKLAGR